jgi:hypothetical protein
LFFGVWRNAAEPPFTITTGETVWWEAESDGVLTGTEGTVRYGIGSSGAELTVHWDNPFVGRSTYDGRASQGWTVLRIGENSRVEYGLERAGLTSARSTPSSRWHIRRSRHPRSPEPTLEQVCSRYRPSPLSRD